MERLWVCTSCSTSVRSEPQPQLVHFLFEQAVILESIQTEAAMEANQRFLRQQMPEINGNPHL